jgi:hypothetical protein
MKTQSRGIDFLEALIIIIIIVVVVVVVSPPQERGLEKLVALWTDGCPSVAGNNVGLIFFLLKIHLKKPNLLLYYCTVHQENLLSRFDGDFRDVIKWVGQIVNYI